MKKFLLEIGVEELPARFIEPSLEQLVKAVTDKLTAQRIDFGNVSGYSTPRRLTVLVENVADQQHDLEQDVKGPPKNIAIKDNELTKAALGFARSQGVAAEDLSFKELDGVEYMFAHKFVQGKATKIVLADVLPAIIGGLSFPKNMRWGDNNLRYARPLRWIVALIDSEIIPFSVENVTSDNITYGHRQLSQGAIKISKPEEYLDKLSLAYVIADQGKRKQTIAQQVERLATQMGGTVQADQDLLDEVTNLVEYPTAFCGSFESEFLEIPAEVLITSMKAHQRYFPLFDQSGKLLAKFIGVRNGADNNLELVTAGNEKVLRARLADAKFFFEEDRKHPLEDNLEKLKTVVFQDGLGSIYDKVQRITAISERIAQVTNHENECEQVKRTALLAKTDLVSLMVNEFPELQGIMGEKYALIAGEKSDVATGISEHYQPRFASDTIPQSITGTIVALADKVDSLVGYFGIEKIPTGSQDPFALRRQALGVLQIIIGHKLELELDQLIDLGITAYGDLFMDHAEQIKASLLEFISGRLRIILLDRGYKHDTIDATLASGISNLPAVMAKVATLDQFKNSPDFVDLYTTFERCAKLATKTDDITITESALTQADNDLHQVISVAKDQFNAAMTKHEYQQGLQTLAGLRKPIDKFFEAVMIMDQDPQIRQNRLGLLKQIVDLYDRYADFGQVVSDM